MKNTFKKMVAGASLLAVLSSGVAFATETMPINEEDVVLINEEAEAEVINAPVEPFFAEAKEIDGVQMLPLRAVAEHFGYAVEWIEESQSVTLTKGAVYVIFSINENAYSFSRMAPAQLEAAPVLVNGETTYVPQSFFTELLNLNAYTTENGVKMVQPRTVSVVSMDTENNTITVMDDFYGEVIVNITDETTASANGESVMAFYLGEGTLIEVEYADFMTMSIPPQTNAVAIEILNMPVEEDEAIAKDAEIVSIEGEQVTVTDEVYGEVVLIVSEETEITANGEAAAVEDLAAGQTVKVEYSEAMTRSIPPQSAALKIEIVK